MAPFADVTFSTEGIVVITALLVALAGALGVVFKLYVKTKDDQLAAAHATAERLLKEEESQKKSYKEIAMEAIAVAEFRANRDREAAGRPPLRTMAAVVPEHSSPVEKAQQDTAELQTLRARVTEVKHEMGMPPREAGPPAFGTPGPDPRVTGTSNRAESTSLEKLKTDVAELKQGQLRADIAEVKRDVAEVPEKTAKRIEDGEAK